MAVTLQQTPKAVDVSLAIGDEFPFVIAFGRDMAGYTVEIKVYRSALTVPVGGGVAAVTQAAVVFTPETSWVSQTAGTLGVTFTESHTAMLSPTQTYRWFVRWVTPGGQTRTLISGSVLPQVP